MTINRYFPLAAISLFLPLLVRAAILTFERKSQSGQRIFDSFALERPETLKQNYALIVLGDGGTAESAKAMNDFAALNANPRTANCARFR